MRKMLLQSTALALGLVVVVLGIMVIIGKSEFLPFLLAAAVLLVINLGVFFVLRKKPAATK